MIGAEAGPLLQLAAKALQQDSGYDQQHQRKSYLPDHNRIAAPETPLARAVRVGGLERRNKIQARCLQGRRQAKQERADQRRANSEQQHPLIDGYMEREWHIDW